MPTGNAIEVLARMQSTAIIGDTVFISRLRFFFLLAIYYGPIGTRLTRLYESWDGAVSGLGY